MKPKSPEPTFAQRVVATLKRVPRGKVVTYGRLAAVAGNPRAARQVVRALYSYGGKDLPWHRVINGRGAISLTGAGFAEQKARLEAEGVIVAADGRVDLGTFEWRLPGDGV